MEDLKAWSDKAYQYVESMRDQDPQAAALCDEYKAMQGGEAAAPAPTGLDKMRASAKKMSKLPVDEAY